MKAITVKQPWAWAIAAGYKTIENRSRNVTYRGPIAIHAGAAWSARGAADSRVVHAAINAVGGYIGASLLVLAGAPKVCPRGALIATAELADCHPANGCCKPWGDDTYTRTNGTTTDCHHLVLKHVRALPEPAPCRGALGLWRVPDDINLPQHPPCTSDQGAPRA